MLNSNSWNKFKNILCVRLDNLGDVLMTSPAIRALKKSVPGRRVSLLTSRSGKAIAPYIEGIDRSMAFDPPWYKHENPDSQRDISGIIEKIKASRFDAAVIFSVFSQNPLPTAMLCYMAGIPRIAGYCRENPYKLITDWIPDREPMYTIKHEVVRQLDLVKALGADVKDDSMSLVISKRDLVSVHARLKNIGVRLDKPWLILHTGASEAKRQYPAELFAETARNIAMELGYQILLTGIAAEKEMVENIALSARGNAFSLAGRLSLSEFIALIKLSPLLISNNTGPVHIAAAVKTPVIVLYALTNPQHTPWKVRNYVLPFDVPDALRSHNTIIRYANERHFSDISEMVTPNQIIEAVREMLFGRSKSFSNAPFVTTALRFAPEKIGRLF